MFYPLAYRMFHNYCNIFFEQIFWMSIWVQLIQHLLCGSITYHKAVCQYHNCSWWRHQMETFSALLAFSAGNSPVSGKFPAQRPVARSFDVFIDLRLNQRLNKQPWGWWYETPSPHYDVTVMDTSIAIPTDCSSSDMILHAFVWHIILLQGWILYTVRCRYNAVNFHPIPLQRHQRAQ